MTEEMKLLRAFIEASGYEVEQVLDYQEREISEADAAHYTQNRGVAMASDRKLKCQGVLYVRGDNGSYFLRLKEPVSSYKVSERNELSIFKG